MEPSFEEAFDFDLNFIQQPVQNVVSDKKLRKAVLIAKKKTIATDTLIKKYHANRELLQETELLLFNAKEECKKVCIDYKNTLEKYTGLEKDFKILDDKYKTLESKYSVSQNQCEAIQSHANQLQLLVKENELKLEALQVERHLVEKKKEKNNVDIVTEKNLTSLTKRNETLLSHILLLKDIVLGKRKLQKQHKVLLSKYNKSDQEANEGNYSSDEIDIFDDCLSPPSNVSEKPHQNQDSQTETYIIFKENTKDQTNGTNGVQECEHDSEDTGRGSSLAFSDGGKFFNSPDYYNQDSPHIETEQNNVMAIKFTDASTCTVYNSEEKATSPIMFDDISYNGKVMGTDTIGNAINSPNYSLTDNPLSTEVITIKEKIKLVDSTTSPIRPSVETSESIDIALSPISFMNEDLLRGTTTAYIKHDTKASKVWSNQIDSHSTIHDLQDSPKQLQNVIASQIENRPVIAGEKDILNHSRQEFSSVDLLTNIEMEIYDKNNLEKSCLEKHNSQNLTENNNDIEVERILRSMRIDHKLLTPIPHTPSKPREKLNKKKTTLMPCSQHECNHVGCIESLKLRRESKVLHKKFEILSKDVMTIKSSLYTLNILPLNNTLNEKSNPINNKINVTKEIDMNTESNLKKNIHENVKETENVSSLTNNSTNILDKSLGINDEDNLPLSHLIPNANFSNPNIRRSITFENEPTKTDHNVDTNIESKNNEETTEKRKVKKHKNKLFEKIKHQMKPKYKIAQNINTILKRKLKPIVVIRKQVEMEKILSSKLAYEKAVKIMAKEKNNDNLDKSKLIENNKESNNSVDKINDVENSYNDSRLNLRKQIHLKEDLILGVPARNKEKNNQLESKQKPVEKRRKSSYTEKNGTKSVNKIDDVENSYNDSRLNSRNQKHLKEDVILGVPARNEEKNNQLESKQKPVERRRKSYTEKNEDAVVTLGDDTSTSVKSNMRTTRSRSRLFEQNESSTILSPKEQDNKSHNSPQKLEIKFNNSPKEQDNNCINKVDVPITVNIDTNNIINCTEERIMSTSISPGSRKRLKRTADEVLELTSKRVLRSSKVKESLDYKNDTTSNKLMISNDGNHALDNNRNSNSIDINMMNNEKCMNETNGKQGITYSDLDLFSTTEKYDTTSNCDNQPSDYPKNSILCKMIDKYGKKSTQFISNKVPEHVLNSICHKLEEDITHIMQLSSENSKQGMNKLVEDIQKLPQKNFILGFMRYLKKPTRKQEMFKTVNTPPAPPMTKAEQILLYIVNQLSNDNFDIVDMILSNIEYTLFQLNRTPEFDVVESMSHFYALVCRYFRLKNRLRLFLLDAMYCLSFKVVTVVKQCLDVWMHILPLAHMGIAKSPLVTCLVYLLHFYKCEDRFKRIDGIRFILHQKYFYRISEWNETKMLEMFKTALREVRDILIEKKILRMALIILAKRQGAPWCQKNIIKNMLVPIIEKEKVSQVSKQFAVSMLGALLKPYPVDMKVHCEIIVNQLLDMLDHNPSDSMKEAIFTSLVYMNKHNQYRVTQALLIWEPKQVSREFEELLRDFVREKPVKTWTKILPKLLFQQG